MDLLPISVTGGEPVPHRIAAALQSVCVGGFVWVLPGWGLFTKQVWR